MSDRSNSPPPLFSREIDDGAILTVIVAAILVVGIFVSSIVHRGELQFMAKKPVPETIGRSIPHG